MSSLAKIKQAGFELSITNAGNIKVIPFSRLTEIQREYLKAHKAEIMAELEAEATNKAKAAYPRYVTCWTPNGTALRVLADGEEHEAFLLKMNPEPTGKAGL